MTISPKQFADALQIIHPDPADGLFKPQPKPDVPPEVIREVAEWEAKIWGIPVKETTNHRR